MVSTPEKKKRILITLLMGEDEREALRYLVKHDHTSQSEYIRRLIREHARQMAVELRDRKSRVPKEIDI